MSDKSYRKYRQYKGNQYKYKVDQVALPIFMMLLIGIFTKFGKIIFPLLGAFIIWKIVQFFDKNRKKSENTDTADTITVIPASKPSEETKKSDMKEKESTVMNTNTPKIKSTEAGFINRNDQRNNGRSNEKGTDHGQWFYHMECLKCGHKYFANGTDIWQRKCPNCQGGRF